MGNASESVLQKIAQSTGGVYYHATTRNAHSDNILPLKDVYTEIESNTIDLITDTNKDGIPDYYNNLIKDGTLVLSNGSKEFQGIDFNDNPDYDGDGVINGDELKIVHHGNRVYLYMISNPLMVHSDTDGCADGLEHQRDTDPMVPTYEGDVVDYPARDDNFNYLVVYNDENSFPNRAARWLLSAFTSNWSHKDEAKLLLASFFKNYYNETDTDNRTVPIFKKITNELLQEMIAQLLKTKEAADWSTNIVESLRKVQSSYNSAKNLKDISTGGSLKLGASLQATSGQLKNRYKFKLNKFKLDVCDEVISFQVDEIADIGQWILASAEILEEEAAFKENKDVLEKIRNYDNTKGKFVASAADDLLLLANEKYDAFHTKQLQDLALATVENAAGATFSILISAESKERPVLAMVSEAVKRTIEAGEVLTSATDIAESAYNLDVIDALVKAPKDLFEEHGSYKSRASVNGKLFYDISNQNIRYVELLIRARMQGDDFAKSIIGGQLLVNFESIGKSLMQLNPFYILQESEKYREFIIRLLDNEKSSLKKMQDSIHSASCTSGG